MIKYIYFTLSKENFTMIDFNDYILKQSTVPLFLMYGLVFTVSR